MSLRDLFLLDPDVVFLNHGSFGATPRPVFDVYQEWQRRLERQPVLFLGREVADHFTNARGVLAESFGASADDLVFVPNATFGVNVIARSLELGPGDEVLASDHEYGACDKTWTFICRKTGANYHHQPIPLPAVSGEEIVEQFWRGVTPRTRAIFLSHITSPTALRLPVDEICRRARLAGILTVIDGAHASGQLSLDMEAIGADFYVGNLHKWALSPKGAAFLYARREVHHLVEPLVVSWGWTEAWPASLDSSFVSILEWRGTMDPSAALSVPAAIDFQKRHNWPAVIERCHKMAREAMLRICDLTSLSPLYPVDAGLFRQLVAAPLPVSADPRILQARLYEEYRIEIPCIDWNGHPLIRLSVQGYNSPTDIDQLLDALKALLW
jgi:isopenicillin-N epimerase